MKAYIINFVLVSIFALTSQFFKKNRQKILSIIFLIIALFVCCYIAGVRSIYVGTDIRVYVTRLFNLSLESNLGYWNYICNAKTDFLFGSLVYLGALTQNINFVLFLIELAVALPIFLYAYLYEKGRNICFIVLIFILNMYVTSFNFMRQSIAISLDILSFYFFNNKKNKTAYCLFLIGILFHKSSIIFIIVYILDYIVKSDIKNKIIYYIALTTSMFLLAIFSNKIISNSIYSSYLGNVGLMREFSIGSILKSFFWVVICGIYLIYKRNCKNEKKEMIELSFLLFLFAFILTMASFRIPGMGRLSYYFYDLALIIFLPQIPLLFKQKEIIKIFCILLLACLWWNMTVTPNNTAGTYPYESEVVNFLNE